MKTLSEITIKKSFDDAEKLIEDYIHPCARDIKDLLDKKFLEIRKNIIEDIKEFDKELKKIVAWEEKGREENFGKNWKIEKPWMAKNYHIPEYKQIVKVICYLMEKFEIGEDELK
jgi:hypothetical protein